GGAGPPAAGRGTGQPASRATLDLSGIVLAGANLTDSRFDGVGLRRADLSGADLTRALLTASDARHADLTQAVLVGTILRDCRLDGLRVDGATAHRAQALRCTPPGLPDAPGWLHAPTTPGTSAAPGRLTALTGHAGWVRAVAYRPDGTQLATAGDDRVVRVWDTATGELLYPLTGHTGVVLAVAYRPDGTQLATA